MDDTSERVITITIPGLIPVSVNHIYLPTMYTGKDGYGHRGRKLTKAAKAYYDAVAIFSRGRTVAPITDAERRKVRYRVEADVYLGRNQRGDADNFGKALLDGLENCGVIHSDAYVHTSVITVHKDQRDNPRTVYTVQRMEP